MKIENNYLVFEQNDFLKNKKITNLKRFNKVFAVDKENIKELIKSALTLKDKVYNERKVSLDIISDEVLSKLGFERPNNDDVLDTLPF